MLWTDHLLCVISFQTLGYASAVPAVRQSVKQPNESRMQASLHPAQHKQALLIKCMPVDLWRAQTVLVDAQDSKRHVLPHGGQPSS